MRHGLNRTIQRHRGQPVPDTWHTLNHTTEKGRDWAQACAWKNGELYVRFKRRVCIYSDPDGKLFEGLRAAPSAGRFVHERLWNLPYR